MKKIMMLVMVSLLLLVACEETAQTTQKMQKADPITFGFIMPLSGDLSWLGQNMKLGVELAVEEINAKGGVNGRNLQVIYEDGLCGGKGASSAANKLINIDGVHYIVGGACSGETIAAAPLAEASKTVLFSPTSSNPSITTIGDFVFRNYPSDAFQGVVAAEFAYEKLVARKVAVLACQSEWCEGLQSVFIKRFKELGGKVLIVERTEVDAKDLRAQLTKIKQVKPELIYMAAHPTESIAGLKQAKELGITAPFLGGDGWADETIWKEVGAAGNGAIHLEPVTDAPESFKTKFKARFGDAGEISLGVPQAYDIVYLLAEHIGKVGDDSVKVKDSLYTVKDWPGIAGKTTLDSNGDLVGAAYDIKVAKNGKLVDYE